MVKNILYRWLPALVLVLVALAITPERLLQLGIMRHSLESSHENIRLMAHLEVGFGRLVLVLGAIVIVFVLPRLNTIFSHPALSPMLAPLPYEIERRHAKVFNLSFFVVSLVLFVLVAAVYISSNPMKLSREDGPVEQLTALTFFIAGILGCVACYRRGLNWTTVPLGLMTAFFIMAAGEEISWGQRFFELETPALMAQYNVQKEINLHNLFGYVADHAYIAGTFLYGAVLPLVCVTWIACLRVVWRTGVPVASMGLAIAFFVASFLHQWTVGHLGGGWAEIRVPELREAVTSFAYLMLVIEVLRLPKIEKQAV